jgi:hypothetical protein
MSDNPQVLDFLREQFSRVHAEIAGVRRDNADVYGHIVLLGQRLDAMSDRLDRIERRLDLSDAPA